MAFKLKDPSDEIVKKLDICLGSKVIGKVEKTARGTIDWHACINVPEAPILHALAQGHGKTPEEAISDAFKASLADAEQFICALKKLEWQLEA